MKQGEIVQFRHSVIGTTSGNIFEIDSVQGQGVYLVKPTGVQSRGGFLAFEDELRRVKL